MPEIKYAGDVHAIFCNGKWECVRPDDHMRNHYWKFLRIQDRLWMGGKM